MIGIQDSSVEIVTNGLVLWLDAAQYRSYPPPFNGTVWTDLSGKGFAGIFTNGPVYTGVTGGGINFDGTNDYVRVNVSGATGQYGTTYPGTGPLSFSNYSACTCEMIAFVRVQGSLRTLLMYEDLLNGNGVESIRFWNDQSVTPNRIDWALNLNNNVNIGFSINVSLPETLYIAGTFVNSGGTYTAFTYKNGNINSGPHTGAGQNFRTESNNEGQRWLIGCGETNSARYSNCIVYVTRIYNRALSSTEIRNNYDAERSRWGLPA